MSKILVISGDIWHPTEVIKAGFSYLDGYYDQMTFMEDAKDKTVIFISHRLSTTRMADRIYMFSEGEIIEEGSHDELMAKNGKYAEMFLVQAEKYKKE